MAPFKESQSRTPYNHRNQQRNHQQEPATATPSVPHWTTNDVHDKKAMAIGDALIGLNVTGMDGGRFVSKPKAQQQGADTASARAQGVGRLVEDTIGISEDYQLERRQKTPTGSRPAAPEAKYGPEPHNRENSLESAQDHVQDTPSDFCLPNVPDALVQSEESTPFVDCALENESLQVHSLIESQVDPHTPASSCGHQGHNTYSMNALRAICLKIIQLRLSDDDKKALVRQALHDTEARHPDIAEAKQKDADYFETCKNFLDNAVMTTMMARKLMIPFPDSLGLLNVAYADARKVATTTGLTTHAHTSKVAIAEATQAAASGSNTNNDGSSKSITQEIAEAGVEVETIIKAERKRYRKRKSPGADPVGAEGDLPDVKEEYQHEMEGDLAEGSEDDKITGLVKDLSHTQAELEVANKTIIKSQTLLKSTENKLREANANVVQRDNIVAGAMKHIEFLGSRERDALSAHKNAEDAKRHAEDARRDAEDAKRRTENAQAHAERDQDLAITLRQHAEEESRILKLELTLALDNVQQWTQECARLQSSSEAKDAHLLSANKEICSLRASAKTELAEFSLVKEKLDKELRDAKREIGSLRRKNSTKQGD